MCTLHLGSVKQLSWVGSAVVAAGCSDSLLLPLLLEVRPAQFSLVAHTAAKESLFYETLLKEVCSPWKGGV